MLPAEVQAVLLGVTQRPPAPAVILPSKYLATHGNFPKKHQLAYSITAHVVPFGDTASSWQFALSGNDAVAHAVIGNPVAAVTPNGPTYITAPPVFVT